MLSKGRNGEEALPVTKSDAEMTKESFMMLVPIGVNEIGDVSLSQGA